MRTTPRVLAAASIVSLLLISTLAPIAVSAKDGKHKNPLEKCPVKKGETVYDDFGDDRGGHKHEGNDITADKGTKVIAPFPGELEQLKADGAGKYVKVTSDDGSFMYGMHLKKYKGDEGKVKTGDVIGLVGSSGNAGSVNHLHFEWHPDGKKAMDPYPYLADVCNTAD